MELETKYKIGDYVRYKTWREERVGMITRVEASAYMDAGIVIYSNAYSIRYGTDADNRDSDIKEKDILQLMPIIDGQEAMKTIN